ncbi:DUF4884 domain-containing protein [Runella slithyformis]|uniref:DUF4884 domain-containing protein n=1 Tax=Runella slithyformis (strain ATCC 29530 / DSM 19594 / LMG 11500 / NCIMB 11436 / LSU 4) TaxID=761193 RepID=A0A7U3ZNP7_RUNSL|nr:DUF4884 domain-containing protein [Runella slithyformis]AEI50468.1 hypothetical protein Runsl_4123 [Runella slithyformis DSM 19594]
MKTTKTAVFAIALLTIWLSSCVRGPQQVYSTTNRNYTLDLLFEHEGCKVYRFKDGERFVYWTDCRGKVETAYQDTNKYGSQSVMIQNETTTADSNLVKRKQ